MSSDSVRQPSTPPPEISIAMESAASDTERMSDGQSLASFVPFEEPLVKSKGSASLERHKPDSLSSLSVPHMLHKRHSKRPSGAQLFQLQVSNQSG